MDPIADFTLPDSLTDYELTSIPHIEWRAQMNKKTSPDIKAAMRLTQKVEMPESTIINLTEPSEAFNAVEEMGKTLLGYRTRFVKIEISRRCDELDIDFSPEWAETHLQWFHTPSGRWYFYDGQEFLICTGPVRRQVDPEGDTHEASAQISFQAWVPDLPGGVYQTLQRSCIKPC